MGQNYHETYGTLENKFHLTQTEKEKFHRFLILYLSCNPFRVITQRRKMARAKLVDNNSTPSPRLIDNLDLIGLKITFYFEI